MDQQDWFIALTGILILGLSTIRKRDKPAKEAVKHVWASGIPFTKKEEEQYGKGTEAGHYV